MTAIMLTSEILLKTDTTAYLHLSAGNLKIFGMLILVVCLLAIMKLIVDIESGSIKNFSYGFEQRLITEAGLPGVIVLALYIILYEILIRGYLLLLLTGFIGFWKGLIVCSIIYTLLHINRNWKVIIVSFPLGIILGYSVFYFQSLVPSIILHLTISLGYSFFSHLKIHRLKQQQS